MIGIFGGTFDPVHLGHLQLARLALEQENFEKLLFVPNYKNPLKTDSTQAEGRHRMAMLELAIAGWDKRVSVSPVEIEREGPSYSFTTVKEVLEKHGKPVCFLLGEEVYRHLHEWFEARSLLEICSFLVVNRPGEPASDLSAPFRALDLVGWKGDDKEVILGSHWVRRLTLPPLPYSSTEIRQILPRVDRDGPAPDGLHQQVWEYIKENRLYCR